MSTVEDAVDVLVQLSRSEVIEAIQEYSRLSGQDIHIVGEDDY